MGGGGGEGEAERRGFGQGLRLLPVAGAGGQRETFVAQPGAAGVGGLGPPSQGRRLRPVLAGQGQAEQAAQPEEGGAVEGCHLAVDRAGLGVAPGQSIGFGDEQEDLRGVAERIAGLRRRRAGGLWLGGGEADQRGGDRRLALGAPAPRPPRAQPGGQVQHRQ